MNSRLTTVLPILVLFAPLAARGQAHPNPSEEPADDLQIPSGPASTAESPPAPTSTQAPSPSVPASPGTQSAQTPPAVSVDTRLKPPSPTPVQDAQSAQPKASNPATEKKAVEAPTQLQTLQIGDIEWSGYVQIDYQHSQASSDQLQQGNGPLNQNRFLLRRGRLRADRYWSWAVATLEIDLNTISAATVGIRRAEGSLFYRGSNPKTLPPLVMFTAGVTDLPFGYELPEPDHSRVFMERTLASSALFPTKMDTGIKLSGAIGFLRYGISLSNGEPVDGRGFPRDPNNAKDLTGRFGADVPIRNALRIIGGISFAKGTGFHAGSPATKSSVVWRDENQDGIAQSTELVGVPGTGAQPSANFDRWALGADLGFEIPTAIGSTRIYGELYAASNYDRSYLVADPISSGVDVRELGGYAAVTQQITPFGLLGLRVATYDPNADIFEERQGKLQPRTQTVRTISAVGGLVLPQRARLLFEYDFIRDYLGRDSVGVPTDARNDTWTARLQVNL